MNIQKTLFQNQLMKKDVGKRDDYPAVADLGYSGQVFTRMKKELSVVTAKGKVCGGSRLMEATSERRTLCFVLFCFYSYPNKHTSYSNVSVVCHCEYVLPYVSVYSVILRYCTSKKMKMISL